MYFEEEATIITRSELPSFISFEAPKMEWTYGGALLRWHSFISRSFNGHLGGEEREMKRGKSISFKDGM